MKEKKRIPTGRLIYIVALALPILILIFTKLFPSPYGPDHRLIANMLRGGTIVAAVAMIVMLVMRAIRNKHLAKVGTVFLTLALALVVAINCILPPAHIILGLTTSPMDRTEPDTTDITAKARNLTERMEAEGLVMLKNSGALPLNAKKLNVFGYASDAIVFGGAGSGAGDESKNVSLPTALENAGFEVNPNLISFYLDHKKEKEGGFVAVMLGSGYDVPEVPVSEYSGSLIDDAKSYSDTAVVVLSRSGGEGADMPMDMTGFEGGTPGKHYMEITETEQAMLDMVCKNFQNVVVLINSSSPIELGFLEDSGVDAALWIGGPGSAGLNSVAQALSGEVNPSGRLADTYAYDLTTSPAYYNAGDFTYTGSEHPANGMIATLTGAKTDLYKFVDYAEGIYVGYRYYETAAADGFIDYEKTVQFPFGYGLSYTSFEQTMGDLKVSDGSISVDVTVKNTGKAAGKEVVQLYYTAPYTKGGIEKSHVVLCAFDKTDLLAPGESQTVTLTFAAEDMSSYDYKNAKAYVLEKGDYEIKLMRNSHEVIDSRTYTVNETTTGRKSDATQATNLFDDAHGDVQYLSRADWKGTFPKGRTTDRPITPELMAALSNVTVETNPDDADVIFKKHGLTLADVRGLAYDDPKWEQLLEQLSVSDMEYLIGSSGWQNPTIHSVGKPAVIDVDGPAGINGMFNGIMGTQYVSEVVLASTWNTDLAEEFGTTLAEEAVLHGAVGLYAPAMNTHRTPFTGRNFEYYSEDGLLAGKMGAGMARGTNSQGVYTYIKHFALNDMETNCREVAVWTNEQAIREVYLKPFELSVKEGGSNGVMSSFNRIGTRWAGGHKELLTDVLRGEWGFVGTVVTDNTMSGAYMDADLAIHAGGDLMLSPTSHKIDTANTNTGHQQMRRACHNILYTVANSAAMEVVHTGFPTWGVIFTLLDVVLLGLIALGYIFVSRKKAPKAPKEPKAPEATNE